MDTSKYLCFISKSLDKERTSYDSSGLAMFFISFPHYILMSNQILCWFKLCLSGCADFVVEITVLYLSDVLPFITPPVVTLGKQNSIFHNHVNAFYTTMTMCTWTYDCPIQIRTLLCCSTSQTLRWQRIFVTKLNSSQKHKELQEK